MAKNTITGGGFLDLQNNPVSYGTLVLKVSHDAALNSNQGFVCAGIPLFISLDVNGNVVSNTQVWPTDQMLPNTVTYTAWVLTNSNTEVWGPHQEVVLTSPSPYPLTNWT
jgi:hypothetical protein